MFVKGDVSLASVANELFDGPELNDMLAHLPVDDIVDDNVFFSNLILFLNLLYTE